IPNDGMGKQGKTNDHFPKSLSQALSLVASYGGPLCANRTCNRSPCPGPRPSPASPPNSPGSPRDRPTRRPSSKLTSSKPRPYIAAKKSARSPTPPPTALQPRQPQLPQIPHRP